MNAQAERFIESYLTEYEREGYQVLPGGELYIQNGSTVFASCTVSNYREALLGQTMEPGSVMLQRCFRTRTLDELHLPVRPTRRALFDMYGGYESTSPDDVNQKFVRHSRIVQKIFEDCGVDASSIVFMGNREDYEKWQLDPSANGSVTFGTYDEMTPTNQKPSRAGKKIKQYGDGVTGHGLEVFIRQPDAGWSLAGNIVETLTPDNNTSGIDFGGGLEATVEAIHGPDASYLDLELGERFGLDSTAATSSRLLNMLEALESLLIIVSHETDPHPLSSTGHAVDMATRATAMQCAHLGIEARSLQDLVHQYSGQEVPDKTSADRAVELVVNRQELVARIARLATTGHVGKLIQRRREQAVKQNHPFSAKTAATVAMSHIHEVDGIDTLKIPNGLTDEELLLSRVIAI